MKSVTLLLICCVLPVTKVYSQISTMFQSDTTEFCCNDKPGAQVQTAYSTLAEVVNRSPTYDQVVTNSFYTQLLDNVCHTYYPFGNGTYICFTALKYADDSVVVQKFIVSDLPSYTGVSRFVGLAQETGSGSIIYDEAFLGCACPDLRVYYRKILGGRCDIVEYATLGDVDFVHGDSFSRDISDYCKSQVAAVASSQCLKGTTLSYMPNRLNRHCVTQWNGVSCINADKVLPQDSYTLEDSESSCLIVYT